MKAKMFLFDFEHDAVVDVSDGKASISEGRTLSNNGQINRIGKAILRADNGNGLEYIAGLGGGVGAGILIGCCAMIDLICGCKLP